MKHKKPKKPLKKPKIDDAYIDNVLDDGNQEAWETGKLGRDPKHAKLFDTLKKSIKEGGMFLRGKKIKGVTISKRKNDFTKNELLNIKVLKGSLSRALHKEMIEKKLSTEECARIMEVDLSTVDNILYGKVDVSLDLIFALSKLIGKVPYIKWKDPNEITNKDFPLKEKV